MSNKTGIASSSELRWDAGVPTTFLLTSFYWENFIFFGLGPQRGKDGVLAVTYPMGDKKLPSIAVEDIGKCAYGIFKRGGELVGQTVEVAGEHPTGAEIAATFTRALGEEVRYNDVPPDVFRTFDFPGADDIGNMFQFKADFNDLYCANRSVEFSRSLKSRAADARPVDGGEQGAHPARRSGIVRGRRHAKRTAPRPLP